MEIRHRIDAQRFEVEQEGQWAVLKYELQPGSMALNHTLVPPALEGRGIGSALVKASLEYARENHLKVIPNCSFVAAYLERHPEEQDLIQK